MLHHHELAISSQTLNNANTSPDTKRFKCESLDVAAAAADEAKDKQLVVSVSVDCPFTRSRKIFELLLEKNTNQKS